MPIDEQDLEKALKRGRFAAYRWLNSTSDAEDACQEAGRKALEARERFDGGRPFYPWFYRILQNVCFSRLSKGRRDREASESLKHTSKTMVQAVAESALLDQELGHALQTALGRLKPEYAQIIELRHFDDLNYDEIAALLDLPQGTVMSRLYRARKELRALMATGGRL